MRTSTTNNQRLFDVLSHIFVFDVVGVAVFVFYLPFHAFVQVRQSKNVKPNSNSAKNVSVQLTESDVAKMVELQHSNSNSVTPLHLAFIRCLFLYQLTYIHIQSSIQA